MEFQLALDEIVQERSFQQIKLKQIEEIKAFAVLKKGIFLLGMGGQSS